jgi:hypothetical protein
MTVYHPAVESRANLESITHRWDLFEVAIESSPKKPSICPWVASRAVLSGLFHAGGGRGVHCAPGVGE